MHKLVGFACVAAVSLAGCATSAQFGPAVETFKALFSKPADVTLTAEELANYPYAAQYIRVAENPRATIVLAQQQGGIDYYASSEGRLISLKQGRLIGTDGFSTDAAFVDALPAPQAAIDAAKPVCWRSSWRAWGELQAGHYLLTGCLQPVQRAVPVSTVSEADTASSEAAEPALTIVKEDVRSPITGHRYSNWYWLDADNNVVKSEQQLGPLLPRWSFETIRRAAVQPEPQAVKLPETYQASVPKGATLNDLLQSLLAQPNIDWANSVIYSTDREAELNQQRDAVVKNLEAFAAYWQGEKYYGVAATANALAKDMSGWRMADRVPTAVHPARLLISPRHNLALRGRHYVIEANGITHRVDVAGAIHRAKLNFSAGGPLRQLRDTPLWRPGADEDMIYRFPRAGKPEKVSITQGLSDSLVLPGERFFVPFKASWLHRPFADLNEQLLAVFAHRVGEAK